MPPTINNTMLETAVTAYPNVKNSDSPMISAPRGQPRDKAKRTVVALTRDAALCKSLDELTAGDIAILVVADMQLLSDELMRHSGSIALIDCSILDAPVDGVVDALNTQFPDLKILVAGLGTEQAMLATRIADQRVFRFVHKPASTQRLKLFVDAASRPGESSRGSASMPDSAASLSKIDTAVRGSSPKNLAIAGVGAIVAITVGAWIFWPKDKAASTAATAATATPSQSTQNSPARALIAKADQAFAAGKYVGSDGSSAAEIYRSALKIDDKSVAAQSGLDRSIELSLRSAEEALLAGKAGDAAIIAENLRLLTPNNSRLAFLQTQIGKEQSRINADSSLRQANEARQTELRGKLAEFNERMRRSALIDPAGNSAMSRFRDAYEISPGDAGVRSAREQLVAALLTNADSELTARRVPAARRLIDAASSINSSAPGLDVMRRRADEATAQQTAPVAVVAAAAPRQEVAATPPPPVAAPAPAAASQPTGPAYVQASTLTRLRDAVPEYPPRALDQLISGWVEMEFTVARDGTVQDVVVLSAEPRNTFDRAAVSAMRKHRYAPVVRNGEATPQRARWRMRFTAQDGKR
jgi:TonB family protein